MVMAVDMSGSIVKDELNDPTNWNTMMDFLSELVKSNQFIINSDNVQIGVVSFNSA